MSTRAEEEAQLARWRLRPDNPFARLFPQLVANEFSPPEVIARHQDRRLQQVLANAAACVPYYRSQFAALGLDVSAIRSQQVRLAYPSRQELVDAMQSSGLKLLETRIPTYEMGDRCPIMAWRL